LATANVKHVANVNSRAREKEREREERGGNKMTAALDSCGRGE